MTLLLGFFPVLLRGLLNPIWVETELVSLGGCSELSARQVPPTYNAFGGIVSHQFNGNWN